VLEVVHRSIILIAQEAALTSRSRWHAGCVSGHHDGERLERLPVPAPFTSRLASLLSARCGPRDPPLHALCRGEYRAASIHPGRRSALATCLHDLRDPAWMGLDALQRVPR